MLPLAITRKKTYEMVMELDLEGQEMRFKDYVLEIICKDGDEKVKSLYYGLVKRDPWIINGHAAYFQDPPHNLQRVVPLEESEKMINEWIDKNGLKGKKEDIVQSFVWEVLGTVLD